MILVFAGLFLAVQAVEYANPLVPNTNLPDPGALVVDGLYIMIATSMGEIDRFPIYSSKDMATWTFMNYVWPHGAGQPRWAKTDFWAPEIHRIEDRWQLYFTARDLSGRLCIGVAYSNGSVFGPYTDSGACLVRDPNVGFIDATVTRDANGENYLIWKEDDNDVGIEHCHIWLQRMYPDGLTMDPTSDRTLLIINDLPWEGPIVEAPWIVQRDGFYYMFYSANACWNESYSVGVARAPRLTGPWVKQPTPVLRANDHWAGPGHCAVIQTSEPVPRWVMLYHSWMRPQIGWDYKRLFLQDEVHWDVATGWPYMDGGSPSWGPMPVP